MRFFYALLGLVSVLMRLAVVASPFAFVYFRGDSPDFAFIDATHQAVLAPVLSLVFAFVFFFKALLRHSAAGGVAGGSLAPEDAAEDHHFEWMTPGTAEYFAFHNGSALDVDSTH